MNYVQYEDIERTIAGRVVNRAAILAAISDLFGVDISKATSATVELDAINFSVHWIEPETRNFPARTEPAT